MAHLTILGRQLLRGPGLLAQHGFAAWLDTGASRVLFDTGATGRVLAENAACLGVDLSTATDVVLSHGHWDHGGGMALVLETCPCARIWIPAGAFLPRWHRTDTSMRDIALPRVVRELLFTERDRWTETTGPVRISDGIWLTGPIAGPRPEWTHRHLVRNEILDIPDEVPEEQALVLDAPDGLMVVVGCAHFGLDNLLDHLAVRFPDRPLGILVGGLHLESAPEPQLPRLADRLRKAGSKLVVPCHCTGMSAAHRLASMEGFACEQGLVGKTLSFSARMDHHQ